MRKLGLTGNTRYRISFFGRLILEVEYTSLLATGYGCGFFEETVVTEWRDANFYDLQELKL